MRAFLPFCRRNARIMHKPILKIRDVSCFYTVYNEQDIA